MSGGRSNQDVDFTPKLADIGAACRIDGMGNAHPSGDYVELILQYHAEDITHKFRISLGQAGLLAAEIRGVLGK